MTDASQDGWYLLCQATRGGEVKQTRDAELRRANGDTLTLRLECTSIAGKGEVEFRVTMTDISDRLESEAVARDNAERLRMAAEATGFGTYEYDPFERCSKWSSQLFEIFGLPEMPKVSLEMYFGMIHPEDRPAVQRCLQQTLDPEGAGSHELEYRIVRPDGQTRWVWDKGVTVFEKRGPLRVPVRVIGTTLDVTEEKQSNEKLRQLNETLDARVAERTHEIQLLAEALANLAEGVVITGDRVDWPVPRILFVNAAVSRITGYAVDELIGRTPRVLIGGRAGREKVVRMREELNAGRAITVELVNYRKDGTAYDAELFVTPLLDETGQRTNFVCIYRDITARKQAERVTRQNERRMRAILASLQAHIAVIDRSGTVVAVNPAWEAFAKENDGVLERCGVGTNYLDVCRSTTGELAEQASQVASGLQAILDRKEMDFSIEYPCHSSTEQRWFLLQATPLRDGTGGAVVSHTNISARVQSELAREQERAFSESMIDTAQQVILMLDLQGRVIRMNAFMEELTGWRLEQVKGCDFFDTFLPERNRQSSRELFQRSIHGQSTRGNISPILTKDGREREIEWYDATLTDQTGQVSGLLCLGVDVTERQLLQREVLEIASQEQRRIGLELHDNTQQQLTGLTLLAQSVAGSLSAMAGSKQDQGTFDRDHLKSLLGKAKLLQSELQKTAQQVNQLSRGLIPVEVDAHGLLSSLRELARQVDGTDQIECSFQGDDSLQVADNYIATHLFRIAQEAVTNAVKHSRANRIRISLEKADANIVLRVIDNGIGIEDNDFSPAGMGLRIMRYRSSSIGGSLAINQAEDGGTEVVCSVFAGQRAI